MTRTTAYSLATLLLALTGCPQPDAPSNQSGSTQTASGQSGGGAATGREKIKIKQEGGGVLCELKPKDDGAKVVDSSEQELYRFKTDAEDGKLKIKDAQDQTLGYVTGDAAKLKIKGADQETVLFFFQRQDDGDYKLEDGDGQILAKVKQRDYGWVIRTGDDQTDLFKVKVKDGKTSLRDARQDGEPTVLYTKNRVRSLAFAALGLEQLSREQQWALLWRLNELE